MDASARHDRGTDDCGDRMGTIIGIDLGTTNSVCSYMDRGEPRIIINEEGGRVTPSVVGFSEDGERFVGDIAKLCC